MHGNPSLLPREVYKPLTRHQFIEGVKDSIDVVHKLDCSRLIVTAGNEMEGVSRRVQHECIVKSLKEAAKRLG